MARVCIFTGKRPRVANTVSHSNMKTKSRQLPNLQKRRLWWLEGKRFVTIRISMRALRTIDRKGLGVYAREVGVDLEQY